MELILVVIIILALALVTGGHPDPTKNKLDQR
jgi:hypothetical protein